MMILFLYTVCMYMYMYIYFFSLFFNKFIFASNSFVFSLLLWVQVYTLNKYIYLYI